MLEEALRRYPDARDWIAGRLGEGCQCALLNDGEVNRSYLLEGAGERLVLRARWAPEAPHGVDAAVERQVLRLIDGADFAPETLLHGEGVWIYRYIEGEVPDGMAVRAPEMLEQIGALLRAVHDIKAPDLPSQYLPQVLAAMEERVARTLERLGGDPVLRAGIERLRPKVAPAIEAWRAGSSLCHNDPHAGNLVRAPAGWKWLDWEYANRGSTLLDSVYFCQQHSLTYEQSAIFLAAAGCGDAPDEEIHLMRLLAEYTDAMWTVLLPNPQPRQEG
ncbi:MAG: phosphotransferase [Gammaproteobacteria bacterium AqS3]|nr:phosphotransferase [Gammaproteobacteria bacterium AqS3]